MTAKTGRSKYANKRTKDQVENDRELAVQLYNKGFTLQEIANHINNTSEYNISREQVHADIKKVRERWLATQQEEYTYLVRRELSRLETFENELWQSWRESKGTLTHKKVEEVARMVREESEGEVDDDELVQLMVNKVITTTQESVGDRGFLELIFKTQQERRKLLGLYAPARLDIDVRETLNIKGYTGGISPNDWPDHEPNVIEGQYSNAGKNG